MTTPSGPEDPLTGLEPEHTGDVYPPFHFSLCTLPGGCTRIVRD
jgi:hypothetical protein